MAEALALEAGPDAIKMLANMPPAERARNMAKLEGALWQRQQMQQQQNGMQRATNPPPRTFTQAPPPIRAPRGGANPPSDIHSLAGRELEQKIAANRARTDELLKNYEALVSETAGSLRKSSAHALL